MLESKQTPINARQKLSYPWLHIFSQVFCSSSRLLKIRGIFGIYALLILSDISLFSTKYMINFAEMSFYVNDNALCNFLFFFILPRGRASLCSAASSRNPFSPTGVCYFSLFSLIILFFLLPNSTQ